MDEAREREKGMQQFTIQAATATEAFDKMRRLYGDDAVILSHRDVRIGGVMGLFARRGVEITGYTRRRTQVQPRGAAETLAPEDLERRKNEILDAIRRHAGRPAASAASGSNGNGGSRAGQTGNSPPAASAPARVGGDQTSARTELNNEILQEIREIKARLAGQSAPESPGPVAELLRLLRRNDFLDEYSEQIEKRLRSTFSLEQIRDAETLERTVLAWIGDSIRIHEPLTFKKGSTRTLVVVGPSGVGKTTTIAKLAAKYGLGGKETTQKNVRIVTIDSYRIGAREQIESYSEIMQIPVSYVETAEELKKVMDLYANTVDLILIDTIGKSPKDAVNLAKMKKVLEGAGHESETHLALSASTKAQDVAEILRQFEPFRYSAVILTKLDETSCTGNAISALGRQGKSLSYITTGQRVPQDIERASRLRLLMNLDGFRVNREELGKKYGEERLDDEEWG
jgi:flagellar biosynthesis protein FlhF